MKIALCGTDLVSTLGRLDRPVEVRSLHLMIAGEYLRMADAYLHDGQVFLKKGDPVNALASFAYAFGWVDCGEWVGLFESGTKPREWGVEQEIPASLGARLTEKTTRYARLLRRALASVSPAAEPGTVPRDGGERVILSASVSADIGDFLLLSGYVEEALFCYSYGHAWLDASVRAGLLSVGGERELFTI
ncbi:MAG: DUF357 domain-containing protein [Methanoregulaceae archaeon]|nr:DUF357 domain-containing protein [Methanoregulaceae archaeon]